MSDNIYRNNVYSKGEAMWHEKGRVGDNDETAEQVYGQMEPVTFEQVPFALNTHGVTIPNNVFGIIKVEGSKVTLMGETKNRYKLVQPVEYIRKFDAVVGKPCETLGFLGSNADKLFLTWKMRNLDIHGDIMRTYGMISLGFDGKWGNHLFQTKVRTICENTHAMAIADATQTENYGFGADRNGAIITTRHTQSDHLDVLGYWMKFVDEETERQAKMSEALFCKMQETPLTIDDAYGFFAKVHPYPTEARTYIPAELVSKENQTVANLTAEASHNREVLMALFTGSEGIAIDKTVYGGYNCVTQMQNHHIMSKRSNGADSILIGSRGKVMDTAFKVAVDWVSQK
jgi:hypothetical protein